MCALLLLPAFSNAPGAASAPSPVAPAQTRPDPESAREPVGNPGDAVARFIFMAVLDGCYNDGVQTEVAQVLTRIDKTTNTPENFVYACPVCMPAFDALALYRDRPKFYAMKGEPDTFGPGLPDELYKKLVSDTAATRQNAWTELLHRWIERRMDLLRLSQDERAKLHLELVVRMKKGTSLLESYKQSGKPSPYLKMSSCPSCDAVK